MSARSICVNDTDGDGNCPACARNPEAPCRMSIPELGDRFVKRAAPDGGRIVTVTRVWTADDGHTAVAYDWRDDKPGRCGSACPLKVFHQTYRAEGASVSARDAIDNLGDCYLTPGLHRRLMALVDAYAHELAEKQRAKASQYAIFRSEDMRLRAEGLREGANLIDPEVGHH